MHLARFKNKMKSSYIIFICIKTFEQNVYILLECQQCSTFSFEIDCLHILFLFVLPILSGEICEHNNHIRVALISTNITVIYKCHVNLEIKSVWPEYLYTYLCLLPPP